MTVAEDLGVRLRLIESCRELIPENDRRPSTRKFAMLLELYSEDTSRRINGCTPDLEQLADLTLGIMLADELLLPFAEKRAEMRGWFYGAEPKNSTQMLYAVIFSAAMAFTQSKDGIQAEWVN